MPRLPYRSCYNIDESYIDMSSHFIYLIDDTGTVWRWVDKIKGGSIPGWSIIILQSGLASLAMFMLALVVLGVIRFTQSIILAWRAP
jgi:hypothetical protein